MILFEVSTCEAERPYLLGSAPLPLLPLPPLPLLLPSQSPLSCHHGGHPSQSPVLFLQGPPFPQPQSALTELVKRRMLVNVSNVDLGLIDILQRIANAKNHSFDEENTRETVIAWHVWQDILRGKIIEIYQVRDQRWIVRQSCTITEYIWQAQYETMSQTRLGSD